MFRRFALALALALTPVLTGCPGQTGDYCGWEGDCDASLTCRQATCVEPDGSCFSHDECPYLCSLDGFCVDDGFCAPGETEGSDCGYQDEVCGDGWCTPSEGGWCNEDCGSGEQSVCGDGYCQPGEACASDCGSYEDQVILPVLAIPQTTEVWCWAASTEMVLSYFGVYAPQCGVVSYWVGAQCCPQGNGIPQCYVAAPTMEFIAQTIWEGGVGAEVVYGSLSFEQVKEQISAGRPIIMGYSGSFAGHVVVLHGYDAAGNLYVSDPMYGPFQVPFGAAHVYNQSAYWSHSIVTWQ